jgi:hypothetical protein
MSGEATVPAGAQVMFPDDEDLAHERLAHRIDELLYPILKVLDSRLCELGFVKVVSADCPATKSDHIELSMEGRHIWRHPEGDAYFRARVQVRCFLRVDTWSGVLATVEFFDENLKPGQVGLLHMRPIYERADLPLVALNRSEVGRQAYARAVVEGLTPEWIAPLMQAALGKLERTTSL